MLRAITLKLQGDLPNDIYKSAQFFHGALMSIIDPKYASELHNNSVNSYSQSLSVSNNALFWRINTLTEEAYEQIAHPILDKSFTGITIKSLDRTFQIIEKTLKTISDFEDDIYQNAGGDLVRTQFLSPTSFKKDDSYVIFPTEQLIIQNLMMRYEAQITGEKFFDSDILSEFVSHIKIVSYRLHSCYAPIEKVKLPAFMGSISFKISGNQTAKAYLLTLLKFAEFSGIGIKTAMGMGAVKTQLLERKK